MAHTRAMSRRSTAKSSKFLQLPGELRNLIYDFANLKKVKARLISRTAHRRPRHRGYNPLGQVSQQLRREFGPLHQRSKKFKVQWRELPTFLEAFHTTPESLDVPPEKITLLLDLGGANHQEPIDVLPVLSMMAANPALKLSVLCGPRVDFDVDVDYAFTTEDHHRVLVAKHIAKFVKWDNPVWLNDIQRGAVLAVNVYRNKCANGNPRIEALFNQNLAPQSVVQDEGNAAKHHGYLQQVGLARSRTIFLVPKIAR